MVDDVNEDYTLLVGTIIKIWNECRAEALNHASRRISSSTLALLGKRRHMDRQANHVEFAVLNRLCRQRLAEDHANFVRSRLLDAAHRKRSLKMEKRALEEHRLSIPCLKVPNGSRWPSRPEMENIMANFYTALYESNSGHTAVLSPEEEVPPFLTVLIDGERINHLRYANDIVLITRSPDDASEMLQRLDEEGSKAGLSINKTKTKVMRSAFSSRQPVILQGVPLEDVSEYVYLSRLLNMENDIKPEIARRGRSGWAAYNSIKSKAIDNKTSGQTAAARHCHNIHARP
ncbi:hypothetical protein ANCCEY_05924 [Ancylostoma ceylanicum]|uniref:Reverse transcriptase domain-containing protein n=1 Tax=Ancylostoma ceylanicum TaxID=53326 RepID=A0A0D6LSG4_9BILA|nr:hypothetical protein ANCCEY_05924 [Ancylostoma ceylanicum]